MQKASHFNEKQFWAGNKICMQNIFIFAYPAECCVTKNWKWNNL